MSDRFLLTAAGDIVIRHPLFGEGAVSSPGFDELMAFLRGGDLVWGSCEVQFSTRGFRTDSTIAYLVPPRVGRDLGKAGFDVMTVATNHTWDYGPDAFLDTLDNLSAGGVTPVGGGRTPEEAWRPMIRDVGGVRVGILAASCLVPPYYAALDDRPGIAAVRVRQLAALDPIGMMIEPGAPIKMESFAEPEDVERLVDAVYRLKAQTDVAIVSMHWGYGRGTPLATYQRPLAQQIVRAGADMILGNHGHSPTAIETIDGKPVIYSLGNNIAQQDRINATPRQLEIFEDIDPWSVVAEFDIGRDGVRRITLVPTECQPDGLPVIARDPAVSKAILERVARLSARYGTAIRIEDGRAHIAF
ncbi:MAG: CapA family protein [Aquamicrobium sp.]|uniref:CapA family protein n=1 Tax=Aquamicrobium sp. TaxID=1872579 RepID=UPI00349EA09F|nr:CapA family protein [Aquamicrobium sp.]